jgi:DNA-binding transcriptional MerR regulator
VNEHYHIGRLAKLCGRSIHTIRWYEAQGLMPNVGRDRGGRRVYEHGHIDHLLFLDWLRRTGMSVAEMRQFTTLSMKGWRTIGERQALLRNHRAHVEREIADLQTALDMIDAKVAYFAEWAARKRRPAPIHVAGHRNENGAARLRAPRLSRSRR